MRVQAIISYDGSKFQGIQSQPHNQTIQDTIESALKKLNINSKINYAGRTDTGVHALNQSIDFLIPDYWQDLNKLQESLNKIISPSIYIKKIRFVDKNFHSRFDAKARSYRYIITNQYTPFNANYSLYKKNLNIDIIKKAIKLFEGKHNFEYFCKMGSNVNSYEREIYKTNIIIHKNYAIIKFTGNGFLRSQIRMMTQFLLDISDKNLTIKDLELQLNKEKKISTKLVIPNGLYFEKVFYENFNNRR